MLKEAEMPNECLMKRDKQTADFYENSHFLQYN